MKPPQTRLPNLQPAHPVPLRFILVIPFMLQITIAVGLTGWLSLRNGQRAVNEMAAQLRERASSEIAHHLEDQLKNPHQINQLNLEAIQSGALDVQNFKQMGHAFWKQMKVFPVDYVNFANPQGEFIGVERLPDGTLLINERSHRLSGRQLYVYRANQQGERSPALERKDYNPLIEAWYADAAKYRKPLWSAIYQWDDKPEIMSISASYPVYDRTQRLIGVIGVDLILSHFSAFLQELKITPNSQTFIIERNGLLVASSELGSPFKLVRGKAKRLPAAESSAVLIQATARHLLQKFQDFKVLQSYQQIEFTIAEERLFVDVMPWQDELGVDWLIVVVVPESDFMAQIHENTRITIVLCLLSLTIASVLGLMTADWILYPISQFAQATRSIAQGHWEQTLPAQKIEELEVLSQSFNYMSEQLKTSFAELENRVAERTIELACARDDAEAANRAKSAFLASVSHELRTPLNAILGFAQFMQNNPTLPQEHQEQLKIIYRNGSHLLSLINDILKVANLGNHELASRYHSLEQTLKLRAISPITTSANEIEQQFVVYLSQMPIEWRQELYEAAVKGFDQAMLQLIDQIPSHLAPLADTLRHYIQDYQFDAVITMIQRVTL